MSRDELRETILKGEFDQINTEDFMEMENKEDFILAIGFDDDHIAVYAFICYLINKQETAELHDLASSLMFLCFNYMNGGYEVALYHAKRAYALEPSVAHKQVFLAFYEIPETLVSAEYAKKITEEILNEDPKNEEARNFKKNYRTLFKR